jgi:hypothetical protein
MSFANQSLSRRSVLAALAGVTGQAFAQSFLPGITNIGLKGDNDPGRTECGVGALMPWADGLYAVTYNSSGKGSGNGLGLYRIDETLKPALLDVHNGVFANRFIHHHSNQCIIGPYIIDAGGKWQRIEALTGHRLTATMPHLTDPENRIYYQTMEGLFFEMDVSDLKPRLLFNLTADMNISEQPHFKGGYTAQHRVVVTNNGFYKYGQTQAGLFEWDGGKTWRRISDKPHMDVAARENFGNVMFTAGWDERSVLFEALVNGEWQHYRLPKASHAFEHGWQTEWMRIREIETEHYMMDIQGMFYELQPTRLKAASGASSLSASICAPSRITAASAVCWPSAAMKPRPMSITMPYSVSPKAASGLASRMIYGAGASLKAGVVHGAMTRLSLARPPIHSSSPTFAAKCCTWFQKRARRLKSKSTFSATARGRNTKPSS